MLEYRRQGELQMLDINRLLETLTLEVDPNVNIFSISSNEKMFKFTNILVALLSHDNLIKRHKLLL